MDERISVVQRFAFPLALTLLLAACSNTGSKASADVVPEPEVFEAPIRISVDPPVWESAGSQITPRFDLVAGPSGKALDVQFEYVGHGDVSVPDPGSVEPGSSRVSFEGPFACETPKSSSQGFVSIRMFLFPWLMI